MKGTAPITEVVGDGWTPGWAAFFTKIVQALGWVKGWSYYFDLDFPSVAAQNQSTGTAVTIPGVRQGDAVTVTPMSDTNGILYKGVVTGDDTVTIYAVNFLTGPVNPVAMQYRVVVIQN